MVETEHGALGLCRRQGIELTQRIEERLMFGLRLLGEEQELSQIVQQAADEDRSGQTGRDLFGQQTRDDGAIG